jgi:short subunit dehydrogenase-like uncharacterized protein
MNLSKRTPWTVGLVDPFLHPKTMARKYDIVLYGATGNPLLTRLNAGFTGKLCAKYIVQNCPTDLKWAVAGRSHEKLTTVINDIKPLNTNRKAPDVVIADSDDLEALSRLAESTTVVLSVAGPFAM